MKVIEHIEKSSDTLISFEIVPPPRGRDVKDLTKVVESLLPYKPSWIDVTAHSAGAYYTENNDGTIERKIFKKRPGTIGICGIIQNRFKVDTVAHILCNGFTKEETEDALIELNYLGIENVLALRGDGLNYNKKIAKDRSINSYAIDLVEQIEKIKQGIYLEDLSLARPLNFCTGVAGYPEKHFEAPSLSSDIVFLKDKVDMGAEYIATQMFFKNEVYFDFVKKCREAGITVPVVPGLKIIKSAKQLRTIPKNFYIDMPDDFVNEIMENEEHAEEIGVKFAIKQCEELLNFGVPDLHFYVMNDTDQIHQVLKSIL